MRELVNDTKSPGNFLQSQRSSNCAIDPLSSDCAIPCRPVSALRKSFASASSARVRTEAVVSGERTEIFRRAAKCSSVGEKSGPPAERTRVFGARKGCGRKNFSFQRLTSPRELWRIRAHVVRGAENTHVQQRRAEVRTGRLSGCGSGKRLPAERRAANDRRGALTRHLLM